MSTFRATDRIEDVCKKYSCACTVKTAGKPSQPIEKSTAGASLLTQVIVAKYADHLPLHRYRAANWALLGETTGRGKQSNSYVPNRSIKEVLGYPLTKRFGALLTE